MGSLVRALRVPPCVGECDHRYGVGRCEARSGLAGRGPPGSSHARASSDWTRPRAAFADDESSRGSCGDAPGPAKLAKAGSVPPNYSKVLAAQREELEAIVLVIADHEVTRRRDGERSRAGELVGPGAEPAERQEEAAVRRELLDAIVVVRTKIAPLPGSTAIPAGSVNWPSPVPSLPMVSSHRTSRIWIQRVQPRGARFARKERPRGPSRP
jgi:hypothetical protein